MTRAGNRATPGITRGITKGVAASVAVAATGWLAIGLPAAADPGNGNGNAYGHANAGENGNGPAQGNQGNQGGNSDNGKDPKGPKDPNGPKDPKGPKGNNGNHSGQQGHGNDGPGHGGQGNGPGGAGQGGKSDPPGNNGTVKITPHLEDDGIPQNSPHVSCIFDIEWYGFDEGPDIVSTVEFAMQAPTSDVVLSGTEPAQVFVGGDPASGAGTDSGFDGEATYVLGFSGEPHPQQGYHVKLTVHTPGSQGADTKHKVYWVQPCAEAPETVTSADEADVVRDEDAVALGTESVEGQTSSGEAGVLGTESSVSSGEAAVEAGVGDAAAADVPNQVAAGDGGNLARDVATSPWTLLALGLGLLLGGAALVGRRRIS